MHRLRFALVLVLAAIPAASGYAQAAKDYFEPVVSHRQFTLLVRNLDLTQQQRRIVEMVFLDYTDAIEGLAAKADRQADEAGRRTVQEALAGRAIVDPAELRRLRVAVLDVYESYFEAVNREFEKLTLGVRSVLIESQRPKLGPELRALRRTVLLHPRHSERNFHEYAGDGVDVLLLAQEAAAPGGEFERLDPEILAAILEQYEHELDRLLIETAPAHRESRMRLRKARIGRDAHELREAERGAIAIWHRIYQLNEHTVRHVGEVAAAELGADAQQRWLRRFDKASFAWMFARQLPDRQYEWLVRQNLRDEQRARVEDVYEEYLAQRFVLSGQAIAMMIRARAEFGSIVYSMMDPSELAGSTRRLYDDLLRNSGEMASLENATSNRFESLLDHHQQISFRNAVRRR